MNPLFPHQTPQPQTNQNGMAQKLQEFSKMVNGDPQQIVQNLLMSGRMTQEQFQQYARTANQILGRSNQ